MKTIACYFTILLIISCQKAVEEHELLVIDTEPDKIETHNLSEVFEGEGYVKLEANDSCLISQVLELVRTREYIFIRTNQPTRILQFDQEGNFIRQIGSYGQGPGEFEFVYVVALDTVGSRIAVATNEKLLFYDFNGRFITSCPLKKVGWNLSSNILFIEDMIWLYTGQSVIPADNGEYTARGIIYMYDKNLDIVDSLIIGQINLKGQSTNAQSKSNVSVTSSGVYIYYFLPPDIPVFRDTLYQVMDGKMIPSVKLDFEDILRINPNVTWSTTERIWTGTELAERFNEIKNVSLLRFYRSDNYVFADYMYDIRRHFFCYDIKNQHAVNSVEGLIDDIFETDTIFPTPLDMKTGEFYFTKYGYEVEGIIDGVDENSNPVVFFVKTKE